MTTLLVLKIKDRLTGLFLLIKPYVQMMDRYYPLLSFYSTPLPPDSSAPPPIPLLLNQTREPELGPPLMRHVMQVNRSDFQLPISLIQTSISLSPTAFILDHFFFQSSLHLSCLLPFFIESYNGLLRVD